jgi:mRNA-degrading endonuclease toxin of MazEF toxin-antitoxin module
LGLSKASVVNVSKVLTIDKALATEWVRQLSTDAMRRVDNGLRLFLGL